ncbi:hypothetical protein M2405_001332 [Rhodococcus erythropolis]|nr:hypothetical protein [Rhodococcus erythropolis]MCS4253056.1 hypothetical protein [Rhodococcus erythropolis]MCW2428499.1 hypothetical protein [Rhodococcus erythropolis]
MRSTHEQLGPVAVGDQSLFVLVQPKVGHELTGVVEESVAILPFAQ